MRPPDRSLFDPPVRVLKPGDVLLGHDACSLWADVSLKYDDIREHIMNEHLLVIAVLDEWEEAVLVVASDGTLGYVNGDLLDRLRL